MVFFVFKEAEAGVDRRMRPHVHLGPSPAACGGNRGGCEGRRSRAGLAPSADRRCVEFARRWSCLAGREGRYARREDRGGGGGDADGGPRGVASLRREERAEAVANFYQVVDLYEIDR